MRIKPVDNLYFGAHLPKKQKDNTMGYKIHDLKEDIKESITDYFEMIERETVPSVLTTEKCQSYAEELEGIVDAQFKKIEYK